MKLNKFFILLFLANLSFGQFQTTGKIREVRKNGFHEIVLPSEIRSYSKQNLSDIRIFNAQGNEIPYFIKSDSHSQLNTFEEYSIVSKTVYPKKSTSIIVAIPTNKNNNQISLFIANADVEKKYSISGSMDQKEWFGILNSQVLYDLNSTTEASVMKTISYPLSTYNFLKIDFDDRKTLPINILKVGNYNRQFQKNTFVEIKPQKSSTSEIASEKETQIQVIFDGPQVINQINFEISRPTYYKRQAIIYKKVLRKSRRKSQIAEEQLFSLELNSNTQNNFEIPEIFEKEIYIKIENDDNLPLSISAIKFSQKPISLIADLNTGENYSIKTGNKNIAGPTYDLSDFKNNISETLPRTDIYNIQKHTTEKNKMDTKSFWQQAWFMWACIAFGGITILYFTFALVKDLKKQE